jgi:caspase domain-containing protein
MFRILTCFIAFIFLCSQVCLSQEKYALVIGIDQYSPPDNYQPSTANGRLNFQNLQGCKNDALSIKSVLESRFLFSPGHIDTIFDRSGTRDAILAAIDKMMSKCKKGDVAFLFYAGHGSQVYNSLSKEMDKRDETVVPSDTWKEGVADIRDKELAKKFNEFLDKGINLTAIFDCCHSASMSRGNTIPQKTSMRFMPAKDESVYDAKDASAPTPPELRKDGKFMIISAAQDNEFAEEQLDDNSPQQQHGAFTLAFLQALNQQSVDASVLNLFIAIRAILKSNGKKQEPDLAASPERQQETLLGLAKGTIPDKSLVAVSGFNKQKVVLQGGFALGLYKENELIRVKGTDTIQLRIDSVLGVNRSLASIIKGNINDIHAGEFFEVSNWASSNAPLLKLYIPRGVYSYDEINKLAQLNKQLRDTKKIHWINDLEKSDPFATVFFDQSKCFINIDTAAPKEIKNYSVATIAEQVKKDSSFYFELPAPKDLVDQIFARLPKNKSFVIVEDPAQANYLIYGTIDGNGLPAYGLRRVEASAKDSLESMPVQTKYFSLKNNSKDAFDFVADSIYEYALKLSRIRGWLQLSGPKGAEFIFPYHFQMINTDKNETITTGAYRIGDNVSIHLVANLESSRYTGGERYVYIFGIDKAGNMNLFFPDETDGNLTNRFPVKEGNKIITDFPVISYTVPQPSGTDNFFVLTTNEAIPNYAQMFQQSGVRGAADNSPFGNLLGMGNVASRGLPPKLPNTWSIERVSFKCTY